MFAREVAGVHLTEEVAGVLHEGAKGCFRVIKRDLHSLVNIMNAKQTPTPTPEMAKVAIKQGLRG